MKRSGFLKRRKRLRFKRSGPRRSERVVCPPFLEWTREQDCVFRNLVGQCSGRVEAHHAGWHPMGRKADDTTAISCCHAHHAGIHDGGGPWKGTTEDFRRHAQEHAVRNHQARYMRMHCLDALPGAA